jgi:formylglycine-generating enzyme required for sulfatase activity
MALNAWLIIGPSMSHIFISYNRKDREYAYALADHLQERGLNIWIDKVGIEYGVDWWDAIVEGLKQAGAFIVVMTPDAKSSTWVMREVFLAEQWRKPMFPILLDGENWELFVLTQFADLREGTLPDEDYLDRLTEFVTPVEKAVNISTLTPELQTEPPPIVEPHYDVDRAIQDFGAAYRAKQWSDALNILGRIKASGQDCAPFDPLEFERKVQTIIEEEKRQRERDAQEAELARQYGRVRATVEFGDPATGWAALQRFWATFPNYDPDALAEQVRPPPAPPRSVDLIPQPFGWVEIPHSGYSLGKYPVTNAQFKLFIDTGGYREDRWWTETGWAAAQRDQWRMPLFWADYPWNKPDHPVVGVSWHEAVAYCLWLSHRTGERITLPTEEQWHYAAQGGDGRFYPWGKLWDCNRCNTSVKPCYSNATTPVNKYEGKGDSAFGVVDMAGNVWEWCLTDNEGGSNELSGLSNNRVLRGGSWNDAPAGRFRCDTRLIRVPRHRDNLVGFRLARITG